LQATWFIGSTMKTVENDACQLKQSVAEMRKICRNMAEIRNNMQTLEILGKQDQKVRGG
jgi:hypothetical protein